MNVARNWPEIVVGMLLIGALLTGVGENALYIGVARRSPSPSGFIPMISSIEGITGSRPAPSWESSSTTKIAEEDQIFECEIKATSRPRPWS